MKKFDLSLIYRKTQKTGLPPGTLVYTGDHPQKPVHVSVMEYNETHLQEWNPALSAEDCQSIKARPVMKWINIDGVNDLGLIERIGSCFDLHPLVLEDIAHLGQRPKMEEYDGYLYIVLKMFQLAEDRRTIEAEQVSLVLGEDYLLTFQENPGDVFEPIRQRLRSGKGRVRKMPVSFLAYLLIDAVVDYYFTIFESIGEQIETLEDKILKQADHGTLPEIHRLKHQLTLIRRSVWPLREMLGSIERLESRFFDKSTRPFLRDLYDHSIQVVETIESFRDVLTGLLDLNLSTVSSRMNEVMKVLTVIATIFIPLSFIAGVYGMNFEHMPELAQQWAYPYGFWILIVTVVAGMLSYFRRKKWL
jgi:magnesium transporter